MGYPLPSDCVDTQRRTHHCEIRYACTPERHCHSDDLGSFTRAVLRERRSVLSEGAALPPGHGANAEAAPIEIAEQLGCCPATARVHALNARGDLVATVSGGGDAYLASRDMCHGPRFRFRLRLRLAGLGSSGRCNTVWF